VDKTILLMIHTIKLRQI